jgi:hypothetical protein
MSELVNNSDHLSLGGHSPTASVLTVSNTTEPESNLSIFILSNIPYLYLSIL